MKKIEMIQKGGKEQAVCSINKKKRNRKLKTEVSRNFVCCFTGCGKSYG
jgi:hypothetical protein